jgi:hypothetical protein
MGSDDWDAYEHLPGGVRPASGLGLVNAQVEIGLCSCGGEIVVTRKRDNDIIAAIQTHQQTDQHLEWRRRKGIK